MNNFYFGTYLAATGIFAAWIVLPVPTSLAYLSALVIAAIPYLPDVD